MTTVSHPDATLQALIAVVREESDRQCGLLQRIYGEICAQRHDAQENALDYPAAAEHLGISERTLRDLVSHRSVPHCRIGKGRGRVTFDRHELSRWKKEHAQGAGRERRAR